MGTPVLVRAYYGLRRCASYRLHHRSIGRSKVRCYARIMNMVYGLLLFSGHAADPVTFLVIALALLVLGLMMRTE